MSLYGALFSGVSGLGAQANKIGIISDNMSNVNTVGFKSSGAEFATLVTNSGTIAYSPGGVLGGSRANIGLQGLLQTTNSNTDVAISGNGFFVVSSTADSTGSINYTRAGSFRQDSTGNFVNAAGYYLKAWPLDRNGLKPGEAGNSNTTSSSSLESLETVNVSSFTGSAAATSTIELSANLQATQTQFQGTGVTADMDSTTGNPNATNNSTDIIVPNSINSLTRGDRIQLIPGLTDPLTMRYGGFTFSKAAGSGAAGDSGIPTQTTQLTLGNNPFTTVGASDNTVRVRMANHGLQSGDVVTITGVTADIDGIPASSFNASFVVTVDSTNPTNTFTIELPTAASAGSVAGGGAAVRADSRVFAGNILDANSPTSTFLGSTGVTGFTEASLSFSIELTNGSSFTYSYISGTPSASNGQFNTMSNLAAAISASEGLTARVVNNVLYISPDDANLGMTFTNGSEIGTGSGTSLRRGIDWVGELGLKNTIPSENNNRFATLAGLASVVNASTNFSATISSADTNASVLLYVNNPLDTIQVRDVPEVTGTDALTSTSIQVADLANNPNRVQINFSAPTGYSDGDVVTIDATGLAGYPSAQTYNTGGSHFETNSNNLITIQQVGHGFSDGDIVNIDVTTIAGYPDGTLNGIPLYELQGNFVVSSANTDDFQITVLSTASSTGDATTPSGTFTISPTINGIPLTDFNGTFEIYGSGNDFEIDVATAATAATNNTLALDITNNENTGSLLAELGIVDSLESASYAPQDTGTLDEAYDASIAATNMASGALTPQYFTNIRIFDSLGTGHDVRVAFIKSGVNTWEAEVYVVPASDTLNGGSTPIAFGTIEFNGDGSLNTVTGTIASSITIPWSNGASDSTIDLGWGTLDDTDGLSQFASDYRLNFANQNGVPVGELIGVTIGSDGIVTARFSNGEEQNLYKIPLADFSNPDGLETSTGNVFVESRESGTVNLRDPGSSGVGTLQASALESSNVELSEQLTGMIVAQRAYQANTKTITTTDRILEELNNILR